MADPRPVKNYSTTKDTVIRVVRPRNHLGESFAGDRVKIDRSELDHPAVSAALWTEEEERAAFEELEKRRAAMFREQVSPISRTADRQLAQAVAARKDREEKDRKTAPEG